MIVRFVCLGKKMESKQMVVLQSWPLVEAQLYCILWLLTIFPFSPFVLQWEIFEAMLYLYNFFLIESSVADS